MGGLLPLSNGGEEKGLQKNLFYKYIYSLKKYKLKIIKTSEQYKPFVLKIYTITNGVVGFDILSASFYSNSNSKITRLGATGSIRVYYKLNTDTNIREFIVSLPNNSEGYIEICTSVINNPENILFEETTEDISTWTEMTES